MSDAARKRGARSSATARGRFSLVRVAARSGRPCVCGVRHAASGSSARPCTRAWIFGTTRNPAGTWAAACPWRRPSALGDLRSVPSDGANDGRWSTAGLNLRLRAASSGAGLTGIPGRLAFGALHSALVGVQPTTVSGPRPSGPGKAAASSRIALHLRRDSVVTSAKRTAKRSERASDDAATGSRLPAEVVGTQRRTLGSGFVLSATW